MNKTYFKYLFKSRKSLSVVVIVLYILAFVTCGLATNNNSSKYILSLAGISIVAGILSYVLVPIIFSYIHDAKAVDAYFSLPVKRKDMVKTNLLFIDLVILVPFIVLSIVCFMQGIATHGISSFFAYVGYQLIAIVGVILVTLFNTSLFIETNSSFDGIVMMLAYALIPFILALAIESFESNLIAGIKPFNISNVISYISLPTAIFTFALTRVEIFETTVNVTDTIRFLIPSISCVVCFIWHFIVSVISIRRNFVERKAERAGSLSNRFFSYPFIIYAYTFLLVLSLTVSCYPELEKEVIIFYAVILVCFLVANFVYRRSIKLKAKDFIYFILIIVISYLISFAGFKTKGFGLAYAYDHNPNNIVLYYDSYMNNDFDSKLGKLVKDKYKDCEFFEYTIDLKLDSKDLDSKSYDLIESLRTAAIDNLYNNNHDGAYIIIVSNYDESYNNAKEVINSSIDKDVSRYSYVPYLSYEDLVYLNDKANIMIEIETNNEYIEIEFNELLAK